jgi:DNA-binding PucR family transcriptional regulator
LGAYFACGRNISSTAVSLNLDRRTVSNRIREVERLFGRPLEAIAPQLELALRLYERDDSTHV